MNNIVKYGLMFLVLLIFQIFIFNGMTFLNYATPFVYIYFILKLPISIGKNQLLILSFLLGLIIDIFSNTPGLNASTSVFIGFLRPYLINALVTLDVAENREPSMRLFDPLPFLRYIGISILIHHALLLTLESFSLFNFSILALRIIVCSVFTFILFGAIESLTGNSHKK